MPRERPGTPVATAKGAYDSLNAMNTLKGKARLKTDNTAGDGQPGAGRPRGQRSDPQARAELRALLGEAPRRRDLLLEFLHRVQDRYGCISSAHMVALAEELKLAPVEVYEVASFYHHFDLVPVGEKGSPRTTVRVCQSLSCAMAGARELLQTIARREGVRVIAAPCVGRCAGAPVAVVGRNAIEHATADAVHDAIAGGAVEANLPEHIDYAQYRAGGGYRCLEALLADLRRGEQVIGSLEASGLRGLGGAGFPAARKWRSVAAEAAPRLMVVNIDEGEPGTFKDRHYLERDPHRCLEGMLIAAASVGIAEIFIYLRDEYAGCREILARALAELTADPPCALPPMHLRRGAGAYICGEESALIESLEGKRGLPRLRPPYVAQRGLFGRPTLVHNLETLYWLRDIVERGGEWWAKQGRHGQDGRGLRSYSVSGRVNSPGVVLAPAGISVRELIAECCGGMQEGHTLYAYLPGGASGGILPASLADLPLTAEGLAAHGAHIGSAAIIVLSQQDSARDACANLMHFFADESCGQCTPCRVGTAKAAQLVQARRWDRPLLEDLAKVMMDASICGLGQAAPNPLLSVMRYFRHEIE